MKRAKPFTKKDHDYLDKMALWLHISNLAHPYFENALEEGGDLDILVPAQSALDATEKLIEGLTLFFLNRQDPWIKTDFNDFTRLQNFCNFGYNVMQGNILPQDPSLVHKYDRYTATHFYLHRSFPYSVRVKWSNQMRQYELTIGYLAQMPFDKKGNVDWTKLTQDDELLKWACYKDAIFAIPARHLYQGVPASDLWTRALCPPTYGLDFYRQGRGTIMDSAHFIPPRSW